MKNNRRGGRSFGNGPWKNRKNNHKNMEEKDNITPQEEATAEVKSEETQQENPLAEEESVMDEGVKTAEETAEDEMAKLKEELAKEKKEYLILMAEFDNFRKRTLKEKSELIKNGGESAFKGLLPIVDDFERALKATENSEDANSVREGMDLIYKKLKKYLEQNGVKEMDPEDKTFDADRHEAITAVPVPDESQKGKIIDTIEKGYTLNDKVLRHAKVGVGQ